MLRFFVVKIKGCRGASFPSGLCRVQTSGGRLDERFFLTKALLESLEKRCPKDGRGLFGGLDAWLFILKD